MKIAVLSQVPPPTHGSTIMTKMLLNTLQNIGLTALLLDRRFSKKIEDVGRFRLSKLISAFFLLVRSMFCFATERPTHLVVFLSSSKFAFLSDLVVIALAKCFKIEVIYYIHTIGFGKLRQKNLLYKSLVDWVFTVANEVVVLSEAMLPDLSLGESGPRIKIIRNTTGKSEATLSTSQRDSDEFCVLYFSNLIESKGVLDFLDMASQVAVGDKKIKFLVAGAPVDEIFFSRVQARVQELGLTHKVTLLGAVDSEYKHALLESIDLLIFPSYYPLEAQPMVIIEALSYGKPVIAYSAGAVRELIGEAGIVVELRDVSQLVFELNRVLSSKTIYEKLSAAAVRRFNGTFSSRIYFQSWKELFGARNHSGEQAGYR